MKEWYYAKENEQKGPVNEKVLHNLLQKGEIDFKTLVWTSGMDDWMPLNSVSSLNFELRTETIEKKRSHNQISQNISSEEFEYAGFWLRTASFLIDMIIIFIGLAILLGIIISIEPSLESQESENLASVLWILGSWLYYAIWESSKHQATPGKKALGLKVVDDKGDQIDFGKATGRYFGKIVSTIIMYIGFVMAGITKKKQALHDIMANCLVIKSNIYE